MPKLTTSKELSPLLGVRRLRKHLGMIPAERILLFPYNGPATPEDVLYLDDHRNVICELVDGILVRKPFGAEESRMAALIGAMIGNFISNRRLGIVLGEAGFLELMPKQVRSPDVSFISIRQLPGGKLPRKRIPNLFPDIAVEVWSASNTIKEMERKCSEYFAQGTRLFWLVRPDDKTVEVVISPTEWKLLRVGQTLDGGDVLPGFKLKLSKLFSV